ncbi:MAG: ParB/RepB/Spo0J family partition protein, partial [Pirellulales bacterium]
KASSFQRYLQQYECTQEELASRVKIDRSTIANLIRLLELPDTVQQALRVGAITMGHARALLPLGDEREQLAFCRRIREESLTVRDTEEQVQALIRQADAEPLGLFPPDGTPSQPRRPASRSEHLMLLEQEMRTSLGTKVDLKQTLRGRGRIVIHFKNHEEFQRIREHLAGPQTLGQSG